MKKRDNVNLKINKEDGIIYATLLLGAIMGGTCGFLTSTKENTQQTWFIAVMITIGIICGSIYSILYLYCVLTSIAEIEKKKIGRMNIYFIIMAIGTVLTTYIGYLLIIEKYFSTLRFIYLIASLSILGFLATILIEDVITDIISLIRKKKKQ